MDGQADPPFGSGRSTPPGAGRAPSRSAALGPLWLQVYIPNLIISTGQGAILPVLALAAKSVGASSAVAGLIVAVNGLGTMLFDLPSGRIVARLGETSAGWVAASLLAAGLLGALFAPTPLLLGISIFVAASGWAVWSLVRLTHISRVAPLHMRGRALSIFGGVQRAGNVIGPFILAALSSSKGVRSSFLVYLVCVVVGFAWLVAARDRADPGAFQRRLELIKPLEVVSHHRRELLTAGVGSFGISLLRGSRQVVIPLWGAHIGLGVSQVALIYGLSSLVDLSLFYPAGIVSDRFGRKAVAVPCIVLLSIGHLALPFSHSFASLLAVAFVLGSGNGLGSGIVMTLGADRAPSVGRASFLAVWRLIADTGATVGPLLDAAIIGFATLALATSTVGLVGLGTAVVVIGWMSEPSALSAEMRETEAL